MKAVSNSKNRINSFIYDNFAYVCVIILIIVFACINKNFIGAYNVKNLLIDTSTLLIIATGVSFPIFLGSTDLSVGHLASFFCVITGTYIARFGNKLIVLCILGGLIFGIINGWLHVIFQIPAFVATLCTGNIYSVLAKIMAGGGAKPIPKEGWPLIEWSKASIGPIPALFIIALVITLVLYVLQHWSIIGKSIMATGANELASSLMGINVKCIKIIAFSISGACAALCGSFLSLRLRSNSPTAGANLTLIAIAGVSLGGTTLFGGHGSIMKTLSGVLLVIIIKNGLNVFGVDAFWTDIIFGTLLILALALRKNRNSSQALVK